MITVTEVCAQLGVGKTKFYDLVNKGELAVHDVSGSGTEPGPNRKGHRRRSIRVQQADVDAFLMRSRVST
jgi:excisionase family DNA binding protein